MTRTLRARSRVALALTTAVLASTAVAGPLAGTALAVACVQNDVTSITLTPASEGNVVGASHTVTATATNAAAQPCQGVQVDFDIVSGPDDAAGAEPDADRQEALTNAAGQVSFTFTNNGTAGRDLLRAYVETVDSNSFTVGEQNATATKDFYTLANLQLETTPEAQTIATGTAPIFTHTVNSIAVEGVNAAPGLAPVSGVPVQLFFVGGGGSVGAPGSAGCTTGVTGTCTTTGGFTRNTPGDHAVSFHITGVTMDGFEGQTETGNLDQACNATGTTGDGAVAEPDGSECVGVTYVAPVAATVDASPETGSAATGGVQTIIVNVRDQFGAPLAGVIGRLEFLTGSANDTDASTTPATPDVSCATATDGAGNCTATYTAVNNGTDTICAYTGTAPADCGEAAGAAQVNGSDADVVTRTTAAAPTNTNPAAQINAEPETDTNPVGTTHDISVFAADATNTPTNATPIRGDIISGGNAANSSTAEITCAPDTDPSNQNPNVAGGVLANQSHVCSYAGAIPGTDTIRVFADLDGDSIYDTGEPFDDVIKIWAGAPASMSINPTADSAATGTCNAFTVTVVDSGGRTVPGATVDVVQVLRNAGTTASGEPRVLGFCTPVIADGPNPVTPVDVTDTAPAPGTPAGTTQNAEVGPTNSAGQVTFGVTLSPNTAVGVVDVRAFFDVGADNDTFAAGEPNATAVKTWTPGGADGVTVVDAEPENDSNPNGTSHILTVTMRNTSGQPVAGVTPVARITAGPNTQGQPGVAPADVYTCTVSDQNGLSTCTFNDPVGTPIGTDTIKVFVNQTGGATAGADPSEPFDDVFKTWTNPPLNQAINLTCDDSNGPSGVALADPDFTPAETTVDCTNPLSRTTETFTVQVTNTQNTVAPGDDTPGANVRVRFTLNETSADTDDMTFTGGFSSSGVGNTATVECDTNTQGSCTVTLNNPTPKAGDRGDVTATVVGQTNAGVAGNNADTASKAWATSVASRITLTPRAATNQINSNHTVTATVLDQFGDPIAGKPVDFRVITGPRAGAQQLDTPTSAGVATFTYTSSVAGTDEIIACFEGIASENDNCADEPGGTTLSVATDNSTTDAVAAAQKFWQLGPVVVDTVVLDVDTTDAGGCESAQTPLGTNTETTVNHAILVDAIGNQPTRTVCATAYQGNAPLSGGVITFTITGPGFFTDSAGVPISPATKTRTVNAGTDGVALAYLSSTASGASTVTATSGGKSDSGTVVFTTAPSNARNIDVQPPTQNGPRDANIQVSAFVLDRFGNPVPNVSVTFTETGPAAFTTNQVVLTDANGRADVQLRSDQNGVSVVTATISNGGPTNGTGPRLGGSADDECEEAANNPVFGVVAGNCTDTGTIIFGTGTPSPTASSTSTAVPTATATTGPPTCTSGVPTSVQLAANVTQITSGNAPTLTGRVFNAAGAPCASTSVTIFAKQYGATGYTALATVSTNANGQFTLVVRPARQTAYGANVSPTVRSNVVVIRVYTRVNLLSPAVASPVTSARAVTNPVTFTGDLDPNFARVAVGLGTLLTPTGTSCAGPVTANCRFVVLQQTLTNATGGFTLTRTLRRGVGVYIIFTSAHQGTDKGSKSITLNVS